LFIVLIRAILLYVLIIFSLRLMGKRQLGELQPTELVITILISNIASLPIEDISIPMVTGAIPILILVAFELFVSNISLKSRGFRKFISGSPIFVIRDGEIDQKALHELRFSIDDLMESLRAQNIFDIRDVHYAVVETTGTVSILQKYEAQTVTPQMLQLTGEDSTPPLVIISDGKTVPEAMIQYQISEQWLNQILKKEKQSIKNIFLMTANQKKQYYIVPKSTGKQQ
jgi:uncharacterized membrane protein YcaP (DUF421 family)